MTEHLFFYLGMALMTMHEMDAIRCTEWRIFPGLSLLSDERGRSVFMLAHLPLFTYLFTQISSTPDPSAFMRGFSIFMIVHMLLHVLYLRHKNNAFKDVMSWSIIIGAAFCGAIELLM